VSTNTLLRIVFGIWAIVFPVIACGPLLLTEGDVAGAISALFALGVFWIAFVPWVLGLVILGFAIVMTNRRDRPGR
jgi:hypothetical protein